MEQDIIKQIPAHSTPPLYIISRKEKSYYQKLLQREEKFDVFNQNIEQSINLALQNAGTPVVVECGSETMAPVLKENSRIDTIVLALLMQKIGQNLLVKPTLPSIQDLEPRYAISHESQAMEDEEGRRWKFILLKQKK